MGASQEALHEIIDQHVREMIEHGFDISTAHEFGQGTEAHPVDALNRARAIAEALHESEDAWRSSLTGKHVLVAGEFPPHLLEELLDANIKVTQLHPAHDGDFDPPHFHHLAVYGLRGITSLHDLANIECDSVLVHGVEVGTEIRVSALVPIVLRMFPNAEKHLLSDDHIAPHMIARIPRNGFRRVSLSM